ncbi:hypothetical protein ACVWXO_004706 [Bradyrhizobium sp. LM2.7]
MPGLVPAIHVLRATEQGVDGRDKPGHDVRKLYRPTLRMIERSDIRMLTQA